ncbi:MAG TPA: LysM peptidoglycan-binding domain-containing protein [Phenylobacterium sp.]|jgi:murein DD-endopeptidase MepM/ murein hydrolase activator NlpD|uniref:LysM peptidoglycan-binding domain-containing protein n=1 Tax=Phenylobacterium sp. TaxID=1871053 RepID=UPI002CA45CAE|nr:LysM peptidoglycan-binding domain-containing protein [Phenylobacterium sp.]HXA40640.1 LysM peptidoglycan-binding domain-containing protein [Phenylobacterium sp.]
MTHFLQRSALILVATTALCAGPALARTAHKAAAATAPTAANGKIVTLKGERGAYVVKKGDTLEKIADTLDTTVAELMSANGLKKTSVLQPGDVIKGPVVTKKAYVVAKGDTVFSIAKRFHVSVDELREENDLTAKTAIRPGQKIRLPADYKAPAVESADDRSDDKADAAPAKAAKGRKGKAAAEPADSSGAAPDRSAQGSVVTREAKGETYKVKKGETLAKVADRLDTDVSVLKRLNHLKGNAVHAGQILHGPSFAEHIYTAQPGDTLASIAQRFSVSVASLRAENELSKRVLSVKSGQKVFLPDGYRDRNAPAEERPVTRYPQPYVPGRGSELSLPAHPIPYAPPGGQAPSATPTAPSTPGPTDAQISQMGKGRFTWPLTGAILSDFGPKAGGQRNDGIDIQADAGAPVRASADGDIVYAGDQVPGFGNLVLIKHADGWATVYAHLSRIDVKMQQKVTQGQQVGQVGATGGVPEPQLHFEVRYTPNPLERARSVDPKLVLPK